MFWTLVLAAGVARALFFTNENSTQNASEGWVAHLRRQLMRDNYDYEPSSDEPGLLPGLLEEPPEPPREDPAGLEDEPRLGDRNDLEEETTTDSSLYVPTFRNEPGDLDPPSEMKQYTGRRLSRLSALANVSRGARRRGAAQQDLLYYVDDAWLHRADDDRDYAHKDNNDLSSGDSDASDERDGRDRREYRDDRDGRRAVEPATKTYKFIKLPGSARRDGLGPRFVEERSEQGVALLSLDGAPFPQFRLPRERRQYQDAELD